jgi:hypothetical protein
MDAWLECERGERHGAACSARPEAAHSRARAARDAGEGLLERAAELRPRRELAAHRERRGSRAVVASVVRSKHGDVEASQRPRRADDREAERVLAEHDRAHDAVGVDQAASVVSVLEQLLAHDAPLDVDVGERGGRDDLTEQPDGLEGVVGRGRHHQRAAVDPRRRVQGRAEPLDGARERVSGAEGACPPVQHVLEEVRDPGGRRVFEADADLGHQADRRPMEVRAGRERDSQATREPGELDARLCAGCRMCPWTGHGGGALPSGLALAEPAAFGKNSSLILISAW